MPAVFQRSNPQLNRIEAALAAQAKTLASFMQKVEQMSETTQQHVDALTATVSNLDQTLKAGMAAIAAEINTLKQANPTVNFSGLDAAVAALGQDVAATVALAPAAPTAPGP